MRLELFTPCEAVSPDGEPCANGDSETRPLFHMFQHRRPNDPAR